ncbi:MAG: radical SAM protein [archaeon]
MKGPDKLMISPTDACNLRCKTCWRLEKKTDPNAKAGEELTKEEIFSLLEDARSMGVKSADLTGGGEPFMKKDILEIIRKSKDLGLFTSLTSNATMLDSSLIKAVVDIQLDDICFSLDGTTEADNDGIRGKGVFRMVYAAIKSLSEEKRRQASEKPVIRLGAVVTRVNLASLAGYAGIARRAGISSVYFSVLLEWSTNRQLSLRGLPETEISRCLLEAQKSMAEQKIASNIGSLVRHGLFEHDVPEFCYAPGDMAFVNSRGDVLACCILASMYENVIGNIRDRPFRELWVGERMQAFRKRLESGHFYPECRHCLPEFVDIFNRRRHDERI